MGNIISSWFKTITWVEAWLQPLVLLAVRLFIASIFWRSGWLKVSNWDSTLFLFQYEYNLPVLPHHWAAVLATSAELLLPVMLVVGLGGRLAALGLLGMALVIELLVYPNTTSHYYWMSIFAMLAAVGPGRISADHYLRWRFKPAVG